VKRVIVAALLVMLVPAGVRAQGRRGRAGGPPRLEMQNQNRRALERQILDRFVEQSGREMGLDADAKAELGRILDSSNDERRALAVEAVQLRQKLMEALRDSRTTDARFREILDAINEVRGREHDLWKHEQDMLSKTLSPRQRAQFMLRWLRLQDNIRGLIDQRPRGGPVPDTLLVPDPFFPEAGGLMTGGG